MAQSTRRLRSSGPLPVQQTEQATNPPQDTIARAVPLHSKGVNNKNSGNGNIAEGVSKSKDEDKREDHHEVEDEDAHEVEEKEEGEEEEEDEEEDDDDDEGLSDVDMYSDDYGASEFGYMDDAECREWRERMYRRINGQEEERAAPQEPSYDFDVWYEQMFERMGGGQ
ncbi:hypothetical protein BGZ72_008455 [Mortierella alpina]|nr:hypothetical protein BGZ72_008455 [Mortierella alpina]